MVLSGHCSGREALFSFLLSQTGRMSERSYQSLKSGDNRPQIGGKINGDQKMSDTDTRDWPSLAVGLYDKLTGRDAEISYEFSDFQVDIPSSTGDDAAHARWKLNGLLKIRTQNGS